MRWLAATLAICAMAILAPAAAHAGDYHSGVTLVCNDCHVMHGLSDHEYNTGGFPPAPIGPNAPYPTLLRNTGNEVCLTCHDSKTWAPDVFGINGGAPRVRSAGALNADPSAARPNDAGYADIDGHTLWSKKVAPGGTWANATDGLECTDCHSAHGAPTQFRNLRTSTSATNKFYNKALTYSYGTNVLTTDVFEGAQNAYAESDVHYNEPNTTASAYGAWCQSCHTNYHGTSTSANMNDGSAWLRHPTADVTFRSSMLTNYNGKTNKVRVMDPTGTWGATADPGITPSCFSCHKSHGNQNGYGLIYMAGTGTVTEEGDGGQFRDLCKQCHTQGG